MELSLVHPADRPTLYRGSSGPWVVHAQRLLRRLLPDLVADGRYGPEMEAAVDRVTGVTFVDRTAWETLEGLK